MDSFVKIVLLLSIVTLASALECYYCNSHNDADCLDMPESAKKKYLINCDSKNDSHSVQYTLCRKLHMFMDQEYGEHIPAENRVHRDCGYVEDAEDRKGDCYYKSGYNTRTWVCSCDFDQCNAAPKTNAAYTSLLVAPLAALLIRNIN